VAHLVEGDGLYLSIFRIKSLAEGNYGIMHMNASQFLWNVFDRVNKSDLFILVKARAAVY
jgi:hypothetical protein